MRNGDKAFKIESLQDEEVYMRGWRVGFTQQDFDTERPLWSRFLRIYTRGYHAGCSALCRSLSKAYHPIKKL